MYRVALCAVLIVVSPALVRAQVIVSEIMYDLKSGADSGREWIEVFNAGSNTVRLTDWKLFESSTAHSIAPTDGGDDLPSGAYAVIADDAAKFRIDWPAYGGLLFDSAFSLSNAGEPIGVKTPPPTLHDSDAVAYGSASGAAGDGNTLHRLTSTGADLVPAAPDPGTGSLSLIPGLSYMPPAETPAETAGVPPAGSEEKSTKSTGAAVTSYVPPPVPQLFADAGGDRTVIVGADTVFDGRAYNRAQEDVERVRFVWNFGDGTTAEGASVLHHFDYPAQYAVTLSIAHDRTAVADRLIVTAEPARLAFTTFGDGSVLIRNEAGRDLDLSRWMVRNVGTDFFLPDESVILSGQSIRIPHDVLGFYAGAQTELAYPNGSRALVANTDSGTDTSSTPPDATMAVRAATLGAPIAAYRAPVPAPPVPARTVPAAAEDDRVNADDADLARGAVPASAAAAGAFAQGAVNWLLVAVAFSAVAGAVAVLLYREQRDAWTIIEETGE